MTRLRAGRRASERGTSAVEFALVVPILLSLLFGVTSAGFSYNTSLAATDATREGARYGATTLNSAAWGSDVQARTVALSYGSVTTSQVCAQLVKVGTGILVSSPSCAWLSEAPPTPTSPAPATGDCIVKVWAHVPFDLNALLYSWTIYPSHQSVARYERTC